MLNSIYFCTTKSRYLSITAFLNRRLAMSRYALTWASRSLHKKRRVTLPSALRFTSKQIRSLAMSYSHMGTPTLPSALLHFTSEFGMDSGGTTVLLSLDKNFLLVKCHINFIAAIPAILIE